MYSHELFWCVRTCMLSYFGPVRLCSCVDSSLPGSSVDGILQAGALEWVAMPSSRGSFLPGDGTQVSCMAGSFFTTSATWEAPLMS